MAAMKIPAGAKSVELEMQVIDASGSPKGAPIKYFWHKNRFVLAWWHLRQAFKRALVGV